MKNKVVLGLISAVLLGVAGCQTTPPDPNAGPHGTIPYDVLIEATPPGARIEADGKILGETPLHITIFGDKDGTFHDFGSDYYIVRALPLATNQYPQMAMYGTGRWFGPEDKIPQQIFFDMNRPPPQVVPGPPVYMYPPPYYYYPPPYYYGPRFYYGPYRYRHLH